MRNVLLSTIFMLFCFSAFAVKYYVTPLGAGTKTGLTWANALDEAGLRSKLAIATPGTIFWVAAGTYKPHDTDPNVAFQLLPGVKIYGGFAGTETLLTQRNWSANPTIFSGDLGTAGDYSDNSHAIVQVIDPTSASWFDGFFVKFGNGANSGGGMDINAGVNVVTGTLTMNIKNCVFEDNNTNTVGAAVQAMTLSPISLTLKIANATFFSNHANDSGGAIGMDNNFQGSKISLLLTDCSFHQNDAGYLGGAVYMKVGASGVSNQSILANLTRCQLTQNTAFRGGAFGTNNQATAGTTTLTFLHSKFQSNGSFFTTEHGGAIDNECIGTKLIMTATADTFMHNAVREFSGFGGAIHNYGWDGATRASICSFTDCRFVGNRATRNGSRGAAYSGSGMAGTGTKLDFNNCVFEDNTAPNGGAIFDESVGRTLKVTDCTFLGSPDYHYAIGSAISKMGNLQITNSSFSDFVSWGPGASSTVSVSGGTSTRITESHFFNNHNVFGIGTDGVLGIHGPTQSLYLRNSLINDNYGYPMSISEGAATIVNSTIAGHTEGLKIYGTTKTSKFYNSILWDNGSLDVSNSGASIVDKCIIQSGFGGASTADPIFIGPALGNYHIAYASPARNAGKNLYIGTFPTDLDGNPRIAESVVDLGCYETLPSGAMKNRAKTGAGEMRLFPNPASEYVWVELGKAQDEVCQILIINVLGEIVARFEHNFAAADLANLPLGGLPSGNYQVRVLGKGSEFSAVLQKTE